MLEIKKAIHLLLSYVIESYKKDNQAKCNFHVMSPKFPKFVLNLINWQNQQSLIMKMYLQTCLHTKSLWCMMQMQQKIRRNFILLKLNDIYKKQIGAFHVKLLYLKIMLWLYFISIGYNSTCTYKKYYYINIFWYGSFGTVQRFA